MIESLPQFLGTKPLDLVLFGGKGGVGKTTCATASALFLSQKYPEDKFLLVSTDPAHSVCHSLGDSPTPPNLDIVQMKAEECLENFKTKHAEKLREIARRGTFLDDEDITRFLDLSLPGMDELMAFLEISGWVGRYRTIVVDTAPTGHTLRFLTIPDLMERWIQAMDTLLAKHRYMKKLYSGTYLLDELDHFLLGLNQSVKKMKELLQTDQRCRFVVVTVPEKVVLRETLKLVKKLRELAIPSGEIVVNRLYLAENCDVCHLRREDQRRDILPFMESMPFHSFWGIPLYPEEMRCEALNFFWKGSGPLEKGEITLRKNSPFSSTWKGVIETPLLPPSPQLELLLFAGKGGVGKTTLACATALYLAREWKGREILLLSTDPAHSLSDCLNREIGGTPTGVIPGLKAMEIDAEAEFETLKREYQEELKDVLGSLLQGLDLSFDREVMERLLDLAPPGIDEVMALMRAMDFLSEGACDLLILDSAPTGHLLRLLEMPALIDQWLKTFFGLFLKYRKIFRLPRLSQRMVDMSRHLKGLVALLHHREKSALCGVAIPTEMAWEETRNLIDRCEKMGLPFPLLFLNQATPLSECFLCSSLNRREQEMVRKFQKSFPHQFLSLVYWQGNLEGVERLAKFGSRLYNSKKAKTVSGD